MVSQDQSDVLDEWAMIAGRGPSVQGNALNGSPQAFLIQSEEDLSSQPAGGSQTEVADRDLQEKALFWGLRADSPFWHCLASRKE